MSSVWSSIIVEMEKEKLAVVGGRRRTSSRAEKKRVGCFRVLPPKKILCRRGLVERVASKRERAIQSKSGQEDRPSLNKRRMM